jgi:hypothetical protein
VSRAPNGHRRLERRVDLWRVPPLLCAAVVARTST